MSRVFSLKELLSYMWVIWVYIVWVKTWCSKYAKIAKLNVSLVFRGKVLPTKILVKTSYHDSLYSSHVLCTWLTSREGFS